MFLLITEYSSHTFLSFSFRLYHYNSEIIYIYNVACMETRDTRVCLDLYGSLKYIFIISFLIIETLFELPIRVSSWKIHHELRNMISRN